MQYIAFMHDNTDTQPDENEWQVFFDRAKVSGLFEGGSAIGKRDIVGAKIVPDVTQNIVGYMKFEAETLEQLRELLNHHPVVVNGGTVEVCELPKS